MGPHERTEPSTMKIATIGLDLAKNVFQLHGGDAKGRVVVQRRLRRSQVAVLFAQLPPCLVGMEACAGAPYGAHDQEPGPRASADATGLM
jgi:hypothetical protein